MTPVKGTERKPGIGGGDDIGGKRRGDRWAAVGLGLSS
jgi:hypothetical protein